MVTTRKCDSLEKANLDFFNMGKGAELCVFSKRNQPIHSKGAGRALRGENPSPKASYRVWEIFRDNADFVQSYLRLFLILFPHFPCGVKIERSEKTLPKLQISPGEATFPFKVVSMLDFTDSRWKIWCFPNSFEDVLVQ